MKPHESGSWMLMYTLCIVVWSIKNQHVVINSSDWLHLIVNSPDWLYLIKNSPDWLHLIINSSDWLYLIINSPYWLYLITNSSDWLYLIKKLTWLVVSLVPLFLPNLICFPWCLTDFLTNIFINLFSKTADKHE